MRRLTAACGIFSAFLVVVMFVCTVLQIWTTGTGTRWGETAGLTGIVGVIGAIVTACVWDAQFSDGRGKRLKR